MKIQYKRGDLLKAVEPFVLQGCNAHGAMNSGVAKALRNHDENIYTEYRAEYDSHYEKTRGRPLPVGKLVWVQSDPWIVINAITQVYYGREENKRYVNYEGLALAIEAISFAFALEEPPVPAVAMPLIGAGLAQGRWSIIAPIIEAYSNNFQPVVYIPDGIIPDGVQGVVENVP